MYGARFCIFRSKLIKHLCVPINGASKHIQWKMGKCDSTTPCSMLHPQCWYSMHTHIPHQGFYWTNKIASTDTKHKQTCTYTQIAWHGMAWHHNGSHHIASHLHDATYHGYSSYLKWIYITFAAAILYVSVNYTKDYKHIPNVALM